MTLTSCHLLVEDMEPDHWVAFVRELPGCSSTARTEAEAVAQAPANIQRHLAWLAQRGKPEAASDITVEVVETFNSFFAKDDPDYIVNAIFQDDYRPLTAADVEQGLWLLSQNRNDLLAIVSFFSAEQLAHPLPDDPKFSLNLILTHLANAEQWYFDRFGVMPAQATLPEDVLERLAAVRQITVAVLRTLVGATRIETKQEELWTARKMLRRALWHERDHANHILSYRNLL